jgi:CheY-like chemotaxis protein
MLPDKKNISPNFQNTLTGSLAILIAEDNLLIQTTMRLLLSKFHITPTFANNGKQAVEYFLKQPYDLVFMDLQMPEMDGLEAAKAIREFNRQTPIVAFTSQNESSVKEQIQIAGMNDYLNKAATPDLIYRTILYYTGRIAA